MNGIRGKRFSSSAAHGEQDFELNIASIIDCFTVLITYLLISASFVAMGVFDVNVADQTVETRRNNPGAPVDLTIQLQMDGALKLHVAGQENRTLAFPFIPGTGRDYASLQATLKTLKEKYPDVSSSVVSAQGPVEYHEVIRTIESVREFFPEVSVGNPTGA